MPVIISLLRGVNVGGHHKIKMDVLRDLYASLKLEQPQTYLQSGNVIFRCRKQDTAALSRKIENAIEKRFGFRPSVILRTPDELRHAIAGNPFSSRKGLDPGKLAVTFLASAPSPEARDKVLSIKADPEELHFAGRELYIYFPHGMGRSTLPWAALDKILKTPATARNWNTVTRLLAMADEMESS